MVARVRTIVFHSIEVRPVSIQIQMASGLPAFSVVGLPDKGGGGKPRARALRVERLRPGAAAMGVVAEDDLAGYAALGELALDGALTAVAGVLPAAPAAGAELLGLICPAACGGEAAWSGLEVLAAPNLLTLISHLKESQLLGTPMPEFAAAPEAAADFRDIKVQ